ncbi:MAG: HK97 family phage prohead protease [Phycisphaerales bacterium]|nr:HK97 family phage prohead protease [Phycisphaerales bacterium]
MSIERARFVVEGLSASGSGEFRKVRGIANSFRVMRSGRLILPTALHEWLAAAPLADRHVPLLAQHGDVSGAGMFATIGKVTAVKIVPDGMAFEASLANGTPAAEEAWGLIGQGMLRGVSIGWNPANHGRWLDATSLDLPEAVREQMQSEGRSEVYVYPRIDLVEISLVDVPDDPLAALTARGVSPELARAMEPLRAAVGDALRGIRRDVRRLVRDELGRFSNWMSEWVEDCRIAAGDPSMVRGVEYAEALLADSAVGCDGHSGRAAEQPVEGGFRAEIERWTRAAEE